MPSANVMPTAVEGPHPLTGRGKEEESKPRARFSFSGRGREAHWNDAPTGPVQRPRSMIQRPALVTDRRCDLVVAGTSLGQGEAPGDKWATAPCPPWSRHQNLQV